MRRILCLFGIHKWRWTGCWANCRGESGMIGICLVCGLAKQEPAKQEGE